MENLEQQPMINDGKQFDFSLLSIPDDILDKQERKINFTERELKMLK